MVLATPPVRLQHNLHLLGHNDLGGAPNAGEGLAMKVTRQGQRFLYIAHENPPMALSVLDVTDPRDPTVAWQMPLPHDEVRSNSLALRGNILLMAYQTSKPGMQPAGVQAFDVSQPTSPREIAFFDTSGPSSQGVHLITFMDGRYAHITTGARDFRPRNPKDHQFYMIVDFADPARPREVGRWWLPGQREGDAEPPLARHTAPSIDEGFRPHHCLSYPDRPDRAYLGYIDGGFLILDITDMASPRLVSRVDNSPPFPGFTHTALPLFERELLLVTDEATTMSNGEDWPKLHWIVDIRDETNPVVLGTLPKPADFEELHRTGRRIGAHNLHENEPEPGAAKLQNTVATTWFSAGLRMYDIRDPFEPREIAAFIPEPPAGQQGCRISDVFVDDRGLVYAADRAKGGLYILEYRGEQPLD